MTLKRGFQRTPPGGYPTGSRASSSKSQQAAYDRGLKAYSREDYPAARDAWEEAVHMDPGSPLGAQSAEHLRKVETILDNLREIQRK